ncbi:MAG TPA: undecaprenyldiphospho-muramoylpentapeptide beta-N-acetylglucosaminyltransferase [Thermoanaerobaculia bacterium]|nr:undecaprenyldiphospho-muramoylpentapeptide beta-N-acetylglucosaminyltransferase [Thermoanaerobaculia bacterium]
MSDRLMIAGGGTGGHIYPAIAIARGWLAREEERDVVFVGTPYGLESRIVPAAGFRLEMVRVGGLKGKTAGQTLLAIARLPLGLVDAWRLLSRWRPSAVLGVGGYASGPVLLVAALRGVPTLIHEANAFPGLTNRILRRFVKRIAVGFPKAIERFGGKGEMTGNPIRTEFFEAASRRRNAAAGRTRLLLFGGSQGSKILNETMIGALGHLAPLRERLEIVHQTGPAHHDRVSAAYASGAFRDARVVPYLDEMADEMAAADLVISRAGAMTVGELAAVGRAAILVPFAAAADAHQESNARALEAGGGAVVITERELNPERLARTIADLAGDRPRLEAMAAAQRRMGNRDATDRIVNIIDDIRRNHLRK